MSFPRLVLPGVTYLVTRRCTQRQFLLRPDDETNNAFVYCLAHAAEKSGVEVVAFIANSNHYHAVVVDVVGRIPEFLSRFHKLLAKHQNVLRGRRENFWSSEQTSLVELVDPDDVLAKMIYTLTNPVKDQLVEKTRNWPGATSEGAILKGKVLRAHRPRRFFRADGEMPEEIKLECIRPPGWETLSEDDFREMVASAMSKVEDDAANERNLTGRKVLGREAILAQRPTDSPSSNEPRGQLNPRLAARDKALRKEALRRHRAFRSAYATARETWLAGLDAIFPPGTWWLRIFAAVPCAQTAQDT
jgi:putative transposase